MHLKDEELKWDKNKDLSKNIKIKLNNQNRVNWTTLEEILLIAMTTYYG